MKLSKTCIVLASALTVTFIVLAAVLIPRSAKNGSSGPIQELRGSQSLAATTSTEPSSSPASSFIPSESPSLSLSPTSSPSASSEPSARPSSFCAIDCFEAKDTPDCSNSICNATVSAVDPFCTDSEWDSLCAEQACELCGGADSGCGACEAPSSLPSASPTASSKPSARPSALEPSAQPSSSVCSVSDCFQILDTPDCSDPICSAAVSAQDSFCTEDHWDSICAGQACDLCGGRGVCKVCDELDD